VRLKFLATALALALAITGLLTVSGKARASAAATIKNGGSLTVLTVNSQWLTLDPATDTQDAANVSYLDAIYGELFYESPSKTIVPDLASGYQVSKDDMRVTIDIRHGVTFQDGTPFNAAAVVANTKRVLEPSFGCICDSQFSAVKTITAPTPYTVVLSLSKPDASIIQAFIQEAPNWVVSPTALAKDGETAFAQHPVGAGPFEVVSNTDSSQLALQRFPKYWDKGLPHLDKLTFTTVASDQSAYEALQSGSAQIIIGLTTIPIFNEAKSQYNLTTVPSAFSNLIYFNTKVAPFNNKLAREAATYATDPALLLKAVSPGYGVVTETPSGPGSDFYEQNAPGYASYNLNKAKALVKQLGGLSVSILGLNSGTQQQELEALQTEWEAAGMKVTLNSVNQQEEIQALDSNNWTASTADAGNIDPDVGVQGLSSRFGGGGAFSCCNDPALNTLIDQSEQTPNPASRKATFDKIYAYIAKESYGDFLFAAPTLILSSKSVQGFAAAPGSNASYPLIEFENIGLGS
jgi:peptide/nickel transport system substrate-binding protein